VNVKRVLAAAAVEPIKVGRNANAIAIIS